MTIAGIILIAYFLVSGFFTGRFFFKNRQNTDVVTLLDIFRIFITSILGFIIGPFMLIAISDHIILFDKKKKKKPKIDKALFEGNTQVYNSAHDRVQHNLKEFKELNWRSLNKEK